MRKIPPASFALLCLLPICSFAAETAESIIRRIDDNRVYTTEKFTATMIITKGRQKLTKTFFGYGMKKGNQAFMEFTNAEDKGVKYLKIGDELWIYFPDADDVMKISGHMLRQGMMGSDLSYEDMLRNESLEEDYQAVLLPDQVVRDRKCYVVELTAKKPDLPYEKQKLFVDQEHFLPLNLELYARGGRLLKKMSEYDIKKAGNRWVAAKITIQDMRKQNTETTMQFEEMVFDQEVPKDVFTKGYLKRR